MPDPLVPQEMGPSIVPMGQPALPPAFDVGAPPPTSGPVDSGGITAVTKDMGFIKFEDYFPPLDLGDKEDKLVSWFRRDLKACVREINRKMRRRWAENRAVYTMEYVRKFYPSMGVSADFTSGILCENVLEAVDRLSRAVFSPRPLFIGDDKRSDALGVEELQRAEWFMDSVFREDLETETILNPLGFFEFILDGSFILETSHIYECIPQRVIRMYTTLDQLLEDEDKAVSPGKFQEAMMLLQEDPTTPVRLLIEDKIVTKRGMQIFPVNKVDHLVPPGVYFDRDIKFRGRRKYLTEGDLRVLSSPDVGWYEKSKVEKIIGMRKDMWNAKLGMVEGGKNLDSHAEMLNRNRHRDLAFDWEQDMERLGPDRAAQPYEHTFAVYEVLFKYGYKTSGDSKGMIRKWCIGDFEPESGVILHPSAYPHFHERPSWQHFKLGTRPNSYYGFGFGDRLVSDDHLASNAIDLYMDAAAISTYPAFLSVHPEEGARIPFMDGYGPLQIGYVRNVADFQPVDSRPPHDGLIRHVVPIINRRVANRTNITPTSQGRIEQGDPRSPAAKTQMLMQQNQIGIDAMINDWDRTGWVPLADQVWSSWLEKTIYEGDNPLDKKVVPAGTDLTELPKNIITMDILKKKVVWISQASSRFLNSAMREQMFMRNFNLFVPLIQSLAQFGKPDLALEYFIRWMEAAGRELDVRGYHYLIPTVKELRGIDPQAVQGTLQQMMGSLAQGQSPGQMNIQQPTEKSVREV